MKTLIQRTTASSSAEIDACPIEAHARFTSLGGGVLLALCVLLSAIWLMALVTPEASTAQRLVAVLFGMFGWFYLLNSLSERLSMEGDVLVLRSFIVRTRRIQLKELEGVLLIHEGLNLEQGIETLEIRRRHAPPERISLGPCWHRHELEVFLHSLETRLDSPKLLEEVR